jgi:hypothetical protein
MEASNMTKCTRCGAENVPLDPWWCRACVRAQKAESAARKAAALAAMTYGVEIEVVAIGGIRKAAEVVQSVVGGSLVEGQDSYRRGCWHVVMDDGRKWTTVLDGSITDAYGSAAEVVSPIMRSAAPGDMEQVQAIVRALRAAGARADQSCGIHVHVGVNPIGGIEGAAKLARLAASVERVLTTGIAVDRSRLSTWACPLPAKNVAALKLVTAATGLDRAIPESRYFGINLQAYAEHTTCEFRWFNGTVHAGKVRAYITLALALAAKTAAVTTVTPPRKAVCAGNLGGVPTHSNVAAVLDWLGITDKTVREHLTVGVLPPVARAA